MGKRKKFNATTKKQPIDADFASQLSIFSRDIENVFEKISASKNILESDAYLGVVASHLPYVMYGPDNLFPQKILNAFDKDNTIGSVMEAYCSLLVSDGFSYTNKRTKKFFELINADELLEALAWDLVLLDGMSVKITNTPTQNNFVFPELEHVPFSNIRVSKANTQRNQVLFYSALDWSVIDTWGNVYFVYGNKEDYQVKQHLPYSKDNYESLYCKFIYSPSAPYYPTPATQRALGFATISGEAINFHVSYLKNGMVGSVIMDIPVILPASREGTEYIAKFKDEVLATAEREWTRTQNAGKPFFRIRPFNQTDPQSSLPPMDITTFPKDDSDKRYLETLKFTREEKMIALGVTNGAAMGLPDSNGDLGKVQVMEMAYRTMERFRLTRKRKVLERFFNEIVKNAGINDTITIPFVPPIAPEIRVSQS